MYLYVLNSFIETVFKGFLHFFKVSLNIPNELRDSPNQSFNINWTGIAYYIYRLTLDPMGKYSNAFFSETTNMIKAKLYMNVH
jgi:hypothetical protein